MIPGQRRHRQRPIASSSSAPTVPWNLIVPLLLVAALLLDPERLPGQVPQTTRGTEFWIAFMENLGSGGPQEVSDLRLYMASDSVTTVYVHYLPIEDTLEIRLATPGVPVELRINEYWQSDPVYSPELEGVGQNGEGSISNRSFHVTADDEITLYGANIRYLSADAFLTLPDNVLSGSYFVLGYQNGYSNVASSTSIPGYDTHSEFAVVATEDNTEVRVYPTAPLLGMANVTAPDFFSVLLNRGDVYFGQALTGEEHDVTGTEVVATKPVALFAGNQRTAIPTAVGNFRDHLVEQMPPLEAWGREAYLTPHFTPDPRVTYEGVARIVASADGTEIRTVTLADTTITLPDGTPRDTAIERVKVDSLDRGEVLQMPLMAARILATEPVLVAQYEHSVGGNPQEGRIGDPFMMLIPPPTQFDRSYPFQSIVDSGVDVHYVNVVIEAGSEKSLKIDGSDPRRTPVWQPLPGGAYVWAQIGVSAGAHRIEADGPFGLAAYGFGPAMSYGYIGASLFRDLPIDYSRPDILITEECDYVYGSVSDSASNDRGLDSIYATSNSTNVRLLVDEFMPGEGSATWRAELVDPYSDGLLELRVIDRAGRSSTERVGIPGFTIGLGNAGEGGPPELELISYNGKLACTELVLVNYGKHPRRVVSLNLDGTIVPPHSFDVTFPLDLQPEDTVPVRLCTPGVTFEPADLRIVLEGSCADREVAKLATGGISDTVGPSAELDLSGCGSLGVVRFREEDRRFYGVSSISVDFISNGTWHLEPEAMPATRVDLLVEAIDIREDVILSVSATDLAGNTHTLTDTIGGFTLAVYDSSTADRRLAIRLDEGWVGDTIGLPGRSCDLLLLRNYGARRLVIERAFMLGNSLLSIPPAQLPLEMDPGEDLWIEICREGRSAGELIDTLRLEDGCGRWETVALRSPVTPVDGEGRDLCGQLVAVRSFGPPSRAILETPFPNPVSDGTVTVDVGLITDGDITIELHDGRGLPVALLWKGVAVAGMHRLTFEVSEFPSGHYYCTMTTSEGERLEQRLILAR